jgi:hypothetical protein
MADVIQTAPFFYAAVKPPMWRQSGGLPGVFMVRRGEAKSTSSREYMWPEDNMNKTHRNF